MLFVAHPAVGKLRHHVGPHDLAHRVLFDVLAVLGRDHDRGRPDRLSIDVLKRDLALGVGTERGLIAGVACPRQRPQDVVRQVDRRGHQLVGFAARIAEHDSLVAGAYVLVAAGVDALGNIGRLGVHEAIDLRRPPMEPVLLVADAADTIAGDLLAAVVIDRVGTTDLAGKNDLVRRDQGFDRDPRVRIGGHVGVDNRVGDLVANLVRVPFGHRFAGENVISRCHRPPPSWFSMTLHAELRRVPGLCDNERNAGQDLSRPASGDAAAAPNGTVPTAYPAFLDARFAIALVSSNRRLRAAGSVIR